MNTIKSLLPIALLLTIIAVISCGEKKKSAKDLLYDEVIAVHDEIMPKMDDMMKYKKQLSQKIDTLIAQGADQNKEVIESLKKSVKDLEMANDQMMDWMHQFNPDFKDMTKKEIMDYLKDQKTKIEQVGQTTSDALTNAEKLLK